MINNDDKLTVGLGKREGRRLERRRLILSIAATSFLADGYSKTTMSGISVKLGGSKGTLWKHFANKQELFIACLDEATATFRRELIAILTPSGDLRQTLENFVRRYLDKINSPDAVKLYRLIIGECARFPELTQMYAQRGQEAVRDLVTQFLGHHQRAGRIHDTDPLNAAKTLLALCFGGSHHRMLFGARPTEPAQLSQEVALIVDIFLRYYGAHIETESQQTSGEKGD